MTLIDKYVNVRYLALREIYKLLINKGLFDELKTAWYEFALIYVRRWLMDLMQSEVYWKVYYLYVVKYFDELGLGEAGKYSSKWPPYLKNFYLEMLANKNCKIVSLTGKGFLKKDSSIILYGAGTKGKFIRERIIEEDEYLLKMWCDKNASDMNSEVRHPDCISNVSYDAIVITIKNEKTVEEVKDYLLERGVEYEKIYKVKYD